MVPSTLKQQSISIKEFFSILLTFSLTVFAWIFFRANNIGHALSYISEIFSPSLFTIPKFQGIEESVITIILVIVLLCLVLTFSM